MATVDVSSHRRRLLADDDLLRQLPPELREIIQSSNPTNFLDVVADAALIPKVANQIFVYFEDIFADICARWLLKPRVQGQDNRIISAFGRILPFAPYLSVFLEQYLSETSSLMNETNSRAHKKINSLDIPDIRKISGTQLVPILLAVWRLLNFDRRTFRQLVHPSQMQALFTHPQRSVRYLAIRVFCQLLAASDSKLEALLDEHVQIGDELPILVTGGPGNGMMGGLQKKENSLVDDFDGHEINFTFLSLYEQQRAHEVADLRQELTAVSDEIPIEDFPSQSLTPLVVRYGSALLPRPHGASKLPSALVITPTTMTNLEGLSQSLQESRPILLHGLPGSGKTSAVHELSRELGMHSTMVTLHLNEQTDAKMLIGLYSTDSKPGSFSWRPGVLTTAVKEGRWVLIEDLDRAPNEVMSTLLPLVERGELLIPSRGERIRASSSFRLFATVRTSKGMNGQETLPTLLGQRFWQSVAIKMPHLTELRDIILGTYPLLHKYVPDIISVYNQLCNLPVRSAVGGGRGIADRSVTPRDLLKWCRRMSEILISAGCKTGTEPISETTRDWMFMEAVDCFCGSIPNPEAKTAIISSIAQSMHLPPGLVEHYLQSYIPHMEETPTSFKVGRVMLGKGKRANRVMKSRKPFASTSHARRLLEQIAVAVKLREPTLLVGETGIGKTTVVQQLAETLGHKLVAVNLSQQSEVGDLLGGFKPVNTRSLAVPLKEEFEDLFTATGISTSKNEKYLEQLRKCFAKGQWTRVSKLWREAPKMFRKILSELQKKAAPTNPEGSVEGPALKRRKTESRLQSLLDLSPRWDAFDRGLDQFDVQISGGSSSFAFAFVEGNIVKAARNGDWVLLDEINLASPDTLESIADLLASGPQDEPSILLSETGEIERVKAHPDFRIFGAMNPATDVGKRDLPLGLRSRFTELYVSSPDKDLKDLLTIIKTYLQANGAKDEKAADDIARLYLKTKELAGEKRLVDGANEVPHFSLRTLTRVLTYVNDIAPFYGLRRALYEGFSMGFLTLLNKNSEDLLIPEIRQHLLEKRGNAKSLLSQPPLRPKDGKQYVRFQNRDKDRQYWLLQGAETPREREDYIITSSIERNLLNLVRATSTRRFPVLIQGPTSSGKTSMIEYLANFSGNKFVRINNHEHTDLQEYLGTYVSDNDGNLRFQEGLLVQALRQGHWIVLDELNLAPTDVLEALNRLLDDNRELLIPETQEVVRPHENFMLFATQNPPGLYGGRKVLSRAFRNRFLELHFDDIPEDELETILQKRSVYTAPSDCQRIVQVYKELSRLRQSSRLFENKDSFATLRDLFRWALRGAKTHVATVPGALPREEIANHGFMLLAERVRNEEERAAVKKVIETVFKVQINPDQLYDASKSPSLARLQSMLNSQGVVWTHAMRRLYVLVAQALTNNEPVLLVGETGCGKTTVCQLLAEFQRKELHIVNAHQNTETGDLIGSQRPVRNRGESEKLFEWVDGSLVHAMKNGQYFLLDEISLADDSVLERLNSVLEPQRTLLLAEKGVDESGVDDRFVQASESFQFFATMNPGGDFGKKELSPALRNRFTEIWVPPLSGNEDILQIVSSKLRPEFQRFAQVIVEFSYWFGQKFRSTASTAFSIRDILVWVKFINETNHASPESAVIHGAATVFIDTLGANPSALIAIDPKSMDSQRQTCLHKLSQLLGHDAAAIYNSPIELTVQTHELVIGDFSIARAANEDFETGFALHAPTTKLNAMRVVRALQVQKPILLEGSPGVGKTTLVSALARACGQPLTRINLSDQTDLMDLFGTDVPVEGAEAGRFAWRDAPFLRAMQNGEWVLLDEMNLASQSVLEGLNACLDHRGEVYISELDRTFKRHPDFRLFAAQNPHHQGGGRKGLPSSFVNRFIVVYADVFSDGDLMLIAQHNYPDVPANIVKQLIAFISKIDQQVVVEKSFGSQGAPWEFNLRDTLRWLQLLTTDDPLLSAGKVDDFLDIVIRQRFRNTNDRQQVDKLFAEAFQQAPKGHQLFHNRSSSLWQVGLALLQRDPNIQPSPLPCIDEVIRLSEIESLIICIKQNLPCILAGPSGSGKSALLEHVAALAGKSLVVFPMNADIDTMDLVGGFEQRDPLREVNVALQKLQEALQQSVLGMLPQSAPDLAVDLLNHLEARDGLAQGSQYLATKMHALQSQLLPNSELAVVLSMAEELLLKSTGIQDPTFEWLDGIIVQALQKGHWLVLDNANLCSASVLDRLNSLLEPNGFLIINEHCGPNGEPRVVQPHPEFRIFLTVDPRYGELSRAMRNRAIEIHLDLHESSQPPYLRKIAQTESSLSRFGLHDLAVFRSTVQDMKFGHIAAETLSSREMAMFKQYFGSGFGCQVLQKYSFPSVLWQRRRIAWLNSLDLLWNMVEPKSLSKSYQDETPTATWILREVGKLYVSLAESTSLAFAEIQPIHPLQNATLVPLLCRNNPGLPMWLATCYELYLDVMRAQMVLRKQTNQEHGRQPSSLNRLERSFLAGSVAAVAKDSTVGAAKFLNNTLKAIEHYIRQQFVSPETWKERRYFLRHLMHFWWRTVNLLRKDGEKFDEARFQAHLSQGTEVLTKYISQTEGMGDTDTHKLSSYVFNSLEESFVTGFKLTTGLSMEQLWVAYRPLPILNYPVRSAIGNMEFYAPQLDTVRWNTRASIGELTEMTTSLATAYRIVREDPLACEDIAKTVEDGIRKLKSQAYYYNSRLAPVLAEAFEYLRQVVALDAVGSQKEIPPEIGELVVLSDLPISIHLRLQSLTATSRPLHYIGYLMGPEQFSFSGKSTQPAHPWTENLSMNVVTKLESLGAANLQSLQLLEAELPILARHVAKLSEAVTNDPLDKLSDGLLILVKSVTSSLGTKFEADFALIQQELAIALKSSTVTFTEKGLCFDTSALKGLTADSRSSIASEHVVPALVSLWAAKNGTQPRRACLANAWIQLAVALIKLYIPNKMYDPQLQPLVKLESYEELVQNLHEQLQSLQQFEEFFTGNSTNLRCELIQEEITNLGGKPAFDQTVYRDDSFLLSKHRGLQEHFDNTLKTVLGTDITTVFFQHCFGSDTATQQLQVVQRNVAQILYRMASFFDEYADYEDLRAPAVNILHCLEIGLSLAEGVGSECTNPPTPSKALMSPVPFLGGVATRPFSKENLSDGINFLAYIATIVSVEGIGALDASVRQTVFQTFHSFYDQWSQKLEQDRIAEQQRKSMYRYRGGLNEEEEAEQQARTKLFPTYDEDDVLTDMIKPRISDARTLAIQLAEIHKGVFLSTQNTSKSIQDLCKLAIRKMSENGERQITDRTLLPATMMVLDETLAKYNAATTSSLYNFYTDSNLPETRKLVNLVNETRSKFRQMQEVDEIKHLHPIEDVVVACDKVLEQGHSEPLAKLITSVEKLHAFVYEWNNGGWAPGVYKTSKAYDSLTDTIVAWRELELSTWNKLLDMEVRKCEDNANSWWFIAYQAVIAGPMSLAQDHAEDDLQDHVTKLLAELEMYFSTAVVGEFVSRLNLLRQLQKQIDLLVLDWPSMLIVSNALHNFITFYAHFEKVALQSIRSGREPLTKQVNDVLLLAKWKGRGKQTDTNIEALRQNARASHAKLFRVMKKFRDILGHPMKPLIDQGLPDENHPDIPKRVTSPVVQFQDQALTLCQHDIANWPTAYKRLANVQTTVSIMVQKGRLPATSINAVEVVDSFLEDLNSSIAQLRKETPAFLTNENKNLVKHLKSRKRKLFAETLREMRDMGFRDNLGTDVLAQQDSLSAVLATLEPINSAWEHGGTEYYFHRILDLAPRFRNAARDHSEDLTGAEVSRSIGLLERLLQVIIDQRRNLSLASQRIETLSTNIKRVQSLATYTSGADVLRQTKVTNIKRVSLWIVQVLEVAVHLVQVHGKFGSIDNSWVLGLLKTWMERLAHYPGEWESLKPMPESMVSAKQVKHETEFVQCLARLHDELQSASESRPDLAFIFEQIQLWTSVDEHPTNVPAVLETNQKVLVEEVKKLSDSILVAIEKFNKSAVKLPSSTEDAGWLMKYNEVMKTAIKALHMVDITENIGNAMTMLLKVNIDDPRLNKLAMSLMAVVCPIIGQYSSICHKTVETYASFIHGVSKMAYTLSKHFIQLAGQGFCTPQEKSDETSGDSGQLEGGTGLGDGEGAEDISKDIQPDEDLSELAQEQNKESKDEELEDEKDAVDMADEDLQGELGSVAGDDDEDDKGSKSGDEDGEQNEMDEESGDVDDLDPTAVDEKMWDGKDEEEAEKNQQGNKQSGQQKKDEQMAADQNVDKNDAQMEDNGEENEEPESEAGSDGDEDGQFDEMNRQDQNVEEQDTLALPDDMDIDGSDNDSMSSISDDDLDKLSDVQEQDTNEQAEASDKESQNGDEGDMNVPADDANDGLENDDTDEKQEDDNSNIQKDEEMDQDPENEFPDEKEKAEMKLDNDLDANNDNIAPSDVRNGGQDQDANQTEDQDQDSAQNNTAQRESGEMGENAADQDTSTGNKGSVSKSQDQPQQSDNVDDDDKDTSNKQPFKALGDALEKWHRQQREIKEAQEEKDDGQKENADATEQEMASREFQHIQNDDSAADTQAIGTATEEESRPFDDTMAIDEESDEAQDSRVMPEDENMSQGDDVDKMDTSEPVDSHDKQEAQNEEARTGVSTRKGAYDREPTPPPQGLDQEDEEEEKVVQDTSAQLSSTHLSEPVVELRDFEESMRQWITFQEQTHPLSLLLTSQLRLILTPSQSTKLSGAYRTGKRLNIKRIISYIASQYKRDKIWMRRAVPTKRSYQILLCVDDSKSMGESNSGVLALKSLVMVSRALAMLEAGQIGVIGFGANTFVAHDLAEPFASHDAGAKALQRFSFNQDHTDVRLLIRDTLTRFRQARLQNPGRGADDLWQLALILSDGLTPSAEHDDIRRLLREAMEERVMVVFIVMDETNGKKKDSVLNLRSVRFVRDDQGNSEMRIERYLDGFPFQYYLVVHHLDDLPGALADLLRVWFAEVSA